MIRIVHIGDNIPQTLGSLPKDEDKFAEVWFVRLNPISANDIGKGSGYLIGDCAQMQISSRSLIGGFDGGLAMDGWVAWAENIAILREECGKSGRTPVLPRVFVIAKDLIKPRWEGLWAGWFGLWRSGGGQRAEGGKG